MEDITVFHLFMLTLTLSVTVQVFRRRLLDKKVSSTYTNLLLLADIPFAIGGLILLVIINFELLNCCYPAWLVVIPIIFVEFGIIVLVGFIIHEWFRKPKNKKPSDEPSPEFIKKIWDLLKKEFDEQKKL